MLSSMGSPSLPPLRSSRSLARRWSARIRLAAPGTYEARLGVLRSAASAIAQRGGGGALRLVLPTVRAGVLEATADSTLPAYPASHGCVRVPMWVAPQLFSRFGLRAPSCIHL